MEEFVRRAQADDAAALMEMEREARHSLVGVRGGDRRLAEMAEVGVEWSRRCADPTWLVLVAGIDGVVTGYLAASVPDPGGGGMVEQVYVLPESREVGLGDSLMEAALAHLSEAGAATVDGWALPGDRDTKNLFERNGLTARTITVSRDLR